MTDSILAAVGGITPKIVHIGLSVENLEASMTALSAGLGVRWSSVEDRDVTTFFNDVEETRSVRWVISMGEAPQLELIEGRSGSVWPSDPASSIHHVAYWTDDVERDGHRLVDAGYRLEAYAFSAAGRRRFAYFLDPSGVRIELADSESRSAWDSWVAGGEYDYKFDG